jgi:Ribbon-helix-helix domain
LREGRKKRRGGHEINYCETLYRSCWTQDERQSGRCILDGLKDIAKGQRQTLSDLVGNIDTDREHGNLSSALRLFVLDHYQKRAASGWVVDNSVRAAEYTNVP